MLSARPGPWRLILLGVAALGQLVLVIAMWCSGEHWWLPVWARVLWVVALVGQLIGTALAWIGKGSGEQAPPG